jgi:prolipoprotein diacylglyceryltransferase
VFIVVGVVPGAVIGGHISYLLLHADYFGTAPSLLDPTVGGLELGLAVVGGVLTGVCRSLLGHRSAAGSMSRRCPFSSRSGPGLTWS